MKTVALAVILPCWALLAMAQPALVTLHPHPAGALVVRATLDPPRDLLGQNTYDVAWGARDSPGETPRLFLAYNQREDSVTPLDHIAWFSVDQPGLIAPQGSLVRPRVLARLFTNLQRTRLFATGAQDGSVEVFDIDRETPLSLGLFQPLAGMTDQEMPNVVSTADGGVSFAALPQAGLVYAFATDQPGQSPLFTGLAGTRPMQVALSPNGQTLAVAVAGIDGGSPSLALFDWPATGVNVAPRGRFLLPAGSLQATTRLAFDAGSRWVFVPGNQAAMMYVVPAALVGETDIPSATYPIQANAFTLAVSPDHARLALMRFSPTTLGNVSAASGVIQIYDIPAGDGLPALRATYRSRSGLPPSDQALHFTPDNRYLVTRVQLETREMLVIDAQRTDDHDEAHATFPDLQRYFGLALSPCGRMVAAARLAINPTRASGVVLHIAPDPDLNRDGKVDGADLLRLLARHPPPGIQEAAQRDFALSIVPGPVDWLAFSRAWAR